MIEPIIFTAQVFKIQTTIDGGIRLTLDLNTDSKIITSLIEAKQPGISLECACLAVKPDSLLNNKDAINAVQKRSEWKSKGQS